MKLGLRTVRNKNIYHKSREMLFKSNLQYWCAVCGTHSTSYQIENSIFYKSPTFVTDRNWFTLCNFWDFNFSDIDLYLGKFFKIFFPFWNGKFLAFSTGQVWSNCQVYKLQFIRTWMNKNRNKNTWGSNWRKNKNIKARQNVTGSYRKKSVKTNTWHI